MAFMTKDVFKSQLLTCFVIITGALASKYLSPNNPK